jgi:beta-fructofuranosidase
MPADPHRPIYHFSADPWMNDPIPFFWDGQYHVFFQYNPAEVRISLMYWGHVVSRDLVHWEELPVALSPTPGSPDQEGCWTGCVVEEGGRFHILYTGIPRRQPLHQVQCLASSEDLVTWEKYAGNPVIAEQPAGFGECFRDPCAWKEADGWYVIIGSELPEGKGGAALLFRSADLKRWEYLHPFFIGDAARSGHDFECPDYFPLGDRQALLTSRGQTHWHVGQTRDHRFTLQKHGVIDGGAIYAAKTLLDDRGRRLLWGWVREERPGEEQRAAGWSGALSLPRLLTLRPDHSLGIEPVPELEALRGEHRRFEGLSLASENRGGVLLLDGVEGDALELLVRFAPSDAGRVGVTVRCSPDGSERAEIIYDRTARRLGGAPLELADGEELIPRIYFDTGTVISDGWIITDGEELILHIFVDRSVIEAFANGRACHTARFYPRRDDCLGVGLFVEGGSAQVKSVDVWKMRSIKEP